METILLEAPKGLRTILSDLLKPISTKTTEGSNKYRLVFEFIGTVDKPLDKIHTLDASLFEHITILEKY